MRNQSNKQNRPEQIHEHCRLPESMDDGQSRDAEWRRDALKDVARVMFPSTPGVPDDPALNNKRGWCEFVLGLGFTMMVTIQFNQTLREDEIGRRLKRFDAVLQRLFLGRDWAKCPQADRALFVAFVESSGSSSHSHVHILLCRPPAFAHIPIRQWQYELISQEWTALCKRKQICPCGDVDVRGGVEFLDPGAHAYVLKSLNTEGGYFLSSEFTSGATEHKGKFDGARQRCKTKRP